jgi:hypothetical protein
MANVLIPVEIAIGEVRIVVAPDRFIAEIVLKLRSRRP